MENLCLDAGAKNNANGGAAKVPVQGGIAGTFDPNYQVPCLRLAILSNFFLSVYW